MKNETTEQENERRGTSALTRLLGVRGYAGIGLYHPQNDLNIGAALRAAQVYDCDFIATAGKKYSKAPTDTMCGYRHLPLFQVDDLKKTIPYDCVPVAVDLIEGATPLPEYEHPERAFYIFGPENSTLGKKVTDWCRDTIYVPTDGCMNLAASVNVILYDRLKEQWQKYT